MGIPTPAANITLFDIIIQMSDHYISPAPTLNPTLNPTTHLPTQSPIESMISNEPIQLYAFYNEQLSAEYQIKIDLYEQFVSNAIIMALSNLTQHSMRISDYDPYSEKEWSFGGVRDMEQCMIQ